MASSVSLLKKRVSFPGAASAALAAGGNAGLDKAVRRLEPVKKKHPDVSWADLIAYVGVVAIEQMGGPSVPFSYGRVDEMEPSAVTPDGEDLDVCVLPVRASPNAAIGDVEKKTPPLERAIFTTPMFRAVEALPAFLHVIRRVTPSRE